MYTETELDAKALRNSNIWKEIEGAKPIISILKQKDSGFRHKYSTPLFEWHNLCLYIYHLNRKSWGVCGSTFQMIKNNTINAQCFLFVKWLRTDIVRTGSLQEKNSMFWECILKNEFSSEPGFENRAIRVLLFHNLLWRLKTNTPISTDEHT